MRGRKSMCKLSETELVAYLLDKLVNDDGSKVPVRKLWSSNEFIEYTGFENANKRGAPCSWGTARYYCSVKEYTIPVISQENNDKKYTLCEETLYKYHKYVTGRIPAYRSFKDFSREKNKGYANEKDLTKGTIKQKTSKNVINDIAVELDCFLRVSDFDNKVSQFEDFLIFRYDDKFNVARDIVMRRYQNG